MAEEKRKRRKPSFLKYFIKSSLHHGLSILLQKNFAIIFILGALLQYYISPPAQPKMSLSFWMKGISSVVVIGLGVVLVKYRRLLYCCLITLPRDIRGAWRFSQVLRRISWADKRNLTVPKIFDMYADKNPDKICFYFEEEKWTFKQVQDLSNKIGNYYAQKGFVKGDVIALFMMNRPEFVCIWMGLNKIGVCAALVNYNLRLQPLLHSIQVVAAKAVIYGHELSPAIGELMEDKDNLLSTIPIYCSGSNKVEGDSLKNGIIDFDKETCNQPSSTPVALKDMKLNDSLFYIYTSGTTGLSKGAVVKQYRFMMAVNGVHFMNQVQETDILYNALPLYHMTGGMVGIGQALLFGTSVVIRKKFSASAFWKDCIKYDATVCIYLGEICRYLLAQPVTPEERGHKVRLLTGNGLRHEIWQEVVDRFNIHEIGEVYGSTEGNCNTSNIDSHVGSVGFIPRIFYPLMPMTLAKIDERTGDPVRDPVTGLIIRCEPNEPGELVGKIIKHHPIRDFQGYTDEAATDKKILRNVFRTGDYAFRTGDILSMDEFGYFYFKDRTGDTYRWKGENISTTEVEAIISSFCSYKDAVVFGVKIPNTEGRAGMACISDPDSTLDLEDLAAGMGKTLPAYATPLFIRVLDIMDMTGTYKFKKTRFQNDGYDITQIKDKMYFLSKGKYIPLDSNLYDQINSGKIRL